MTFGSILTLLGVWVAAIISPGPDVVQITRQGARSKRAGVWAALGVMTGNTGWILASLLGLSALLTARPALLAWLQLIGGAYLTYLGVSSIRGGLATRRQSARAVHADVPSGSRDSVTPEVPPKRTDADPTAGQAWRAGFTTNLANPKAVLFFGAVFAQFIEPGMGWGGSRRSSRRCSSRSAWSGSSASPWPCARSRRASRRTPRSSTSSPERSSACWPR